MPGTELCRFGYLYRSRLVANRNQSSPTSGGRMLMIPKTVLRVLLFLLAAAACATAEVSIPDTPAGHTLQAWLDAFNSADRAKIENYVKTVDPTQEADGLLAFRNATGGFDLLSIESSDPLH